MVISSCSLGPVAASNVFRSLEMLTMVRILEAKRIVTMNPGNPYATHIAIQDGIILGVGPLEELTGWGDYTLDRTFADRSLFQDLSRRMPMSWLGACCYFLF